MPPFLYPEQILANNTKTTPLQDAAPHVQSKQHLKLFLIISESVDCLVCSDEDLRRNILTDFASINWLTVSTYIYIHVFIRIHF